MGFSDYKIDKISSRILEFVLIIDNSTSMNKNNKASSLNKAIRTSIEIMKSESDKNPNVELKFSSLLFSTQIQWLYKRMNINDVKWEDIVPKGETRTGLAMKELTNFLSVDQMPKRGLPPILILITDGKPGDNYIKELNSLLTLPWAIKAVKLGIGIGEDADFNSLSKFINSDEIKPFRANNANQLIDYIKWASTTLINDVSYSKEHRKFIPENVNDEKEF